MLSSMDTVPYYYRSIPMTYVCTYSMAPMPKPKVSDFNESAPNIFHQWPWRAFAFASDLGIIAHILKKPKWAGLGWLISIPYYVASLVSRPTTAQRKEEGLYQRTANGIFPFLEAHIGVHMGEQIREKLASKIPLLLGQQPQLIWKGSSALLAIVTLTPTVGDKLSDKILEVSQT